MNISSQLLYTDTSILNESILTINWRDYANTVSSIHHRLDKSKDELTGWITTPLEANDNVIQSINNIANEIKMVADVLIVIGIGGSYLGAKAIQDALSPYFSKNPNGIQVIYVGHNMSGAYIQQLIEIIENKEVYINVISKSGKTMETALSFRVFRLYMEKRYGKEAKNRIIVTTDSDKGVLKKTAQRNGYRQLTIPSNVGGRYSVLTPVGLLPVAVAGIDITELLEGATKAASLLKEEDLEKNEAYRYAVIRYELYKKGYQIELLASFEPGLHYLQEWWKQLFGESEGKNKRGLFPASVSYSSDLHSIGQFVQDGSPILFETLIHFKEIPFDYIVPIDKDNDDQLNYLANRSFNEINSVSKQGTVMAHVAGGVPVIQLELDRLDAYHIGYLLYFFMKACAMSAFLLQVNPFDQPGVEAYKKKVMELLK